MNGAGVLADPDYKAAFDAGFRAPVQTAEAFSERFGAPGELPRVDAELAALGIDPERFYAGIPSSGSESGDLLPGQAEREGRSAPARSRGRKLRRRRGGAGSAAAPLFAEDRLLTED